MFDGQISDRLRSDIYDDTAADWWSDEIRWVRTLKNMVPGRLKYFDKFIEWPGKRVLDVGCAGGFMAEAIAKRGAIVSGIDPSAPAIAAGKDHAAKHDLQIDYIVGIGEDLPYEDASFDAVVCVDVLEHVSDLSKAVSEISRVLRPGGLFLFDTINRSSLASFVTITMAEDILRILPQGTHDPKMYIKPEELRSELKDAEFEVGKLTGFGPRGLTLKGDFTFGRLPGTAIIYMGSARRKTSTQDT
ncbi:MAG: bifunctional 2-polyprenyl-6-hydroxyphenol methylase/3-demethylubiquinol 3-O-methyltransferase UbiG [Pseudomonadota bacterium]